MAEVTNVRPEADGYKAGTCNIGQAEIARRRRLGLIQSTAAFGLAVALVGVGAPAWTRLAVWPLLAAAFVTLEQIRRRFCVAFGLAGVRNFGPLGHPERVEDSDARRADRRSAVVLIAYCAAAAGLVTLVFVAVAP
jgi:hypothetical protein